MNTNAQNNSTNNNIVVRTEPNKSTCNNSGNWTTTASINSTNNYPNNGNSQGPTVTKASTLYFDLV